MIIELGVFTILVSNEKCISLFKGEDYDGEEYGSEEEDGDEINYEAEDIDGEEEYTSYDEETLEQNPADDEQQVAATWGQSYAVGSKSSF